MQRRPRHFLFHQRKNCPVQRRRAPNRRPGFRPWGRGNREISRGYLSWGVIPFCRRSFRFRRRRGLFRNKPGVRLRRLLGGLLGRRSRSGFFPGLPAFSGGVFFRFLQGVFLVFDIFRPFGQPEAELGVLIHNTAGSNFAAVKVDNVLTIYKPRPRPFLSWLRDLSVLKKRSKIMRMSSGSMPWPLLRMVTAVRSGRSSILMAI